MRMDIPLFSAPQHSQLNTFLSLPFVEGNRLPQSVQKTRDPIAAIVQEIDICSRP
jgi:hypothetical protein